MKIQQQKYRKRQRRHWRVRNRVHGTAQRPRLSVHRSLKHIYAQVINDDEGKTLVALGTLSKDVRDQVKGGGNVKAAEVIGTKLAEMSKAMGISQVCFDRGHTRYHGRVKALAEAARKGGLKF
jgi:large subunit ribosomal protein L18